MNEYLVFKTEFVPLKTYENVEIHFVDTEDFSLIAVPDWNFSFMWKLNDGDTETTDVATKNKLAKALTTRLSDSDSKVLASMIYGYLWRGKWD